MSGLKRAMQPMPENVRAALKERGLTAAYEVRPDYQRNDYLGWIARAKREETKAKRLVQMGARRRLHEHGLARLKSVGSQSIIVLSA